MTASDDLSQVEAIFFAALEKAPQDRDNFLNHAALSDDLRRRVERLLEAHVHASRFLSSPAIEPEVTRSEADPGPEGVTAESTSNAMTGHLVGGRYKLVEEIGEGGMGTVWLARQIKPVKRMVAVKLIKPGMDSRRVMARFEAERQALALMDHPNIARVLDGGMTDDSRPYFVMEYVKGIPITEYCDNACLNVPQRLALMVSVCQAVQHAHQKGLIHRDLKPSNILVCLYDGAPVPKVIDFGLAKAIHQPLIDHSLHTAHGTVVGTPLYMSPEQAEFNNLDIDTRTDIYALGVLLYELLTGSPPLDKEVFSRAAWQEVLRIIKEQEPPRPSTRLSQSDSLPSIAAQRRSDPAHLGRLLRGDLDWIVMKALEKDRSRRYDTATGLARDIERFLHDDPVEARPPSVAYRLRKFARRNRLMLTASLLVAVSLLMASAVSIGQAIRLSRAERVAQAARAEAEANARRARQVVDRFLVTVSENELFEVPGMQPLRKQLLELALEYYDEFAEHSGDDDELRRARADAHFRAGVIVDEFSSNEQSLAHIEKATSILTDLQKRQALSPADHSLLAKSYYFQARLQTSLHRIDDALATHRLALDSLETIAGTGKADDSLRDHLASQLAEYARTLEIAGQPAAAESVLHRAYGLSRQLANERPHDHARQSSLALTEVRLANARSKAGHKAEAERAYNDAIARLERLLEVSPEDQRCMSYLSSAYSNLSALQTTSRRFGEARSSLQKALSLAAALVQQDRRVLAHRYTLATAHEQLASLELLSHRAAEARAHYEQAIAVAESLIDDDPPAIDARHMMATSWIGLGRLASDSQQYEQAELHIQAAVEIEQHLTGEFPTNSRLNADLAHAYWRLGLVRSMAGRMEEARTAWMNAQEAYKKALLVGNPSPGTHRAQGDVLAMLGQWSDAAALYARAYELGDREWKTAFQLALLQLAADDIAAYRATCVALVAQHSSAATSLETAAIALTCAADDGSVENLDEVLAWVQDARDRDPANPVNLALIGMLEARLGRLGQASSTLKKVLPMYSLAEIAAPSRIDVIRTSRVASEAMLVIVNDRLGDRAAADQQANSLEQLIARYESQPPRYGNDIAAWSLPLVIHLARRELAAR